MTRFIQRFLLALSLLSQLKSVMNRWGQEPSQCRLRTPASRTDDAFFPLSASVYKSCRLRRTLPPALFQQIHPPFHIAKYLYYNIPLQREGTRNTFLEPTIKELVSEDDPNREVPIELRQEATWKSFSPADIHYACGFTDVRLNGFETRSQWHNSLYRRPAWEKTVHDPHAPSGASRHTRNTTPEEEKAREWLEEHQETRLKWAGKQRKKKKTIFPLFPLFFSFFISFFLSFFLSFFSFFLSFSSVLPTTSLFIR